MKKKWLGLLCCCALCFGSCSYTGASVDSLLRPPRLNEEQNAIYTALTRELQTEDIKLVYPQKGDYRSAFTIVNLDDEPTNEAVVFYQASSSSAIRANLLDQRDNQWISLYDMALEGTQIEDIDVLNVGIGVPMLALGLNFVSDGSNLLRLFAFRDGVLENITSYSYQVKAVGDFTEDGVDDLLIIGIAESEVAPQAKLITYGTGGFIETASVYINPNITQYSNVALGYLPSGKAAVYLDAYTGTDSMTTEILSFQQQAGGAYQVVNLTSGKGHVPNATDRPATGATCYDWGNDGVIEAPGLILLPGYLEGSANTAYLTDWYIYYEDDGFTYYKSSYVNNVLGYALDFPESWIGRVSVQQTSEENELLFFEYREGGGEPLKTELLYIKVAKKSDWENGLYADYELIQAQGQIVYLAKIPKDTGASLRVTLTQVKKEFSLYK